MKTEIWKKKSSGNAPLLYERVEGAGDAAEERARRIRPRLRAHERHAHRRGGGLVLANRDPGATDARVAQRALQNDGEHDEHERSPEEDRVEVLHVEVLRRQAEVGVRPVAEAGPVDRGDAAGAVREVEAGAEEVVAVARDLRQDLAEAERDDREVVAAQAQRRQRRSARR